MPGFLRRNWIPLFLSGAVALLAVVARGGWTLVPVAWVVVAAFTVCWRRWRAALQQVTPTGERPTRRSVAVTWIERNRVSLAVGLVVGAAVLAAQAGVGLVILAWVAIGTTTALNRRWRAARARQMDDEAVNGPILVPVATQNPVDPGHLLVASGALLMTGFVIARHPVRVVADFAAMTALFALVGGLLFLPDTRRSTQAPRALEAPPRLRPPTSARWRRRRRAGDLALLAAVIAIGVVTRENGLLGGLFAGLSVARSAQLVWLRRWQRSRNVTLYWHPRFRWRSHPEDFFTFPSKLVDAEAERGRRPGARPVG